MARPDVPPGVAQPVVAVDAGKPSIRPVVEVAEELKLGNMRTLPLSPRAYITRG